MAQGRWSKPWLTIPLLHSIQKYRDPMPKRTKSRNLKKQLNFLTMNCKNIAGLSSMARWVPLPSTLDEVQSRQTRPPLVANKLPWLLPHKGRMPGRSRESQPITILITTLESTELKEARRKPLCCEGHFKTSAHSVSVARDWMTSRSQISKRDAFPCPPQRQGRPGSSLVSLRVSWIKELIFTRYHTQAGKKQTIFRRKKKNHSMTEYSYKHEDAKLHCVQKTPTWHDERFKVPNNISGVYKDLVDNHHRCRQAHLKMCPENIYS